MKSRLAVSTALFDGYQMAQAFEEIAASGCGRVEPAFIAGYTDFTEATFSEVHAREIEQQAMLSGLVIAAVSAHMDLGATDKTTLSKLENRIRFAAACGAKVLITNAGLARNKEAIVERIEQVLPICESLEIMLALENPGHGTGAAVHDLASGRALIGRLDHKLVRLNYDAGNIYSYSAGTIQPGAELKAYGTDGIGYLHLKDVTTKGVDWTFCAIGAGEVNYDAVLGHLNPDMGMSIELPLRLFRPGKGDPVRRKASLQLDALRVALANSIAAVCHSLEQEG